MTRNMVRFGLFLLLVFAFTLVSPMTAMAQLPEGVLAVDATASGNDDGTTWADAYNYLRDAIAYANANEEDIDELWIAEGSYRPDQTTGNPGGSDDRGASFVPRNGLKLYGAFPAGGGDGTFTARDPLTISTILSGDIGDIDDNSDNSYHVIKGSAVGTEETVFNGFIIRAGKANGSPPNDNKGGGVWARTPMAFINSTFDSNGAGFGGAAIWTKDAADVTVRNCIFQYNSAAGAGGAILADGTQPPFLKLNVANTLFIENAAANRGGAIYVQNDTDLDLVNCTFSRNDSSGSGKAVYATLLTDVDIANCIVWDNGGGGNSQITGQTEDVDILIRYSLIQHTIDEDWDFEGNIFGEDPEFADPDADNYRLPDFSPAVDTGDQDLTPVDTYDVDDDTNDTEKTPDLDWRDRVIDGNHADEVDMGPYESVPCPADLDGDCVVGVKDLVILLGDWGSCEGCPADFDFDDDVGVKDLLFLLGAWGPCPCDPLAEVMSLPEKLADVCMSKDNWDEYEDMMTDPESSQEDKDRYDCWMRHYLFECTCMACQSHNCPAPDPFDD